MGRKKSNRKMEAIADAWAEAEETFDDKSTEFMIAWVCDRAGATHDQVMDYLERKARK